MQVIFALISVFLIYLQYTPTRGLSDHTITGDCWPQLVFYDFTYFVGAYTKVTDIILAVVPISVFWKLQMRRSTKTAVCVMMDLMLLSAVVTVVKTTYMPLFTDQVDPRMSPPSHPTESPYRPLVIWFGWISGTNRCTGSIQRNSARNLGPNRAKHRHRRGLHPHSPPLLPPRL
jgi:hypothetical protein